MVWAREYGFVTKVKVVRSKWSWKRRTEVQEEGQQCLWNWTGLETSRLQKATLSWPVWGPTSLSSSRKLLLREGRGQGKREEVWVNAAWVRWQLTVTEWSGCRGGHRRGKDTWIGLNVLIYLMWGEKSSNSAQRKSHSHTWESKTKRHVCPCFEEQTETYIFHKVSLKTQSHYFCYQNK